MAITERQAKIAEVLRQQFSGNFTLDEIFSDTLTGAVTWLRAISMFFAKHEGKNILTISEESIMWKMADALIQNLPPKKEMDEILKWYILHYELYAKSSWEIMEMLLNRIKEIEGEKAFKEFENDKSFREFYDKYMELENTINNRLKQDGLDELEREIWGKSEKDSKDERL